MPLIGRDLPHAIYTMLLTKAHELVTKMEGISRSVALDLFITLVSISRDYFVYFINDERGQILSHCSVLVSYASSLLHAPPNHLLRLQSEYRHYFSVIISLLLWFTQKEHYIKHFKMRFSTVAAAALFGVVSALPGPRPMITTAGQLDASSASDLGYPTSSSCTSTDCWASYAECYGTLTFVYLCYTPPPCGTATSPEPYSCPPPTSAPVPPPMGPPTSFIDVTVTIDSTISETAVATPTPTPSSSFQCGGYSDM
ncbi:hypothetical protein F4777DRAFT_549246 [Nemania sp. FL0916]|nr:hypothetical protein F4777DRAFT_549246 [Nemania sp. FL0916]